MKKVLNFSDFDNLEYRKGSKEYGGLLTKLLEFLRSVKEKDEKELKFKIDEFEKSSNISKEEI
jgi:hypothetical protein